MRRIFPGKVHKILNVSSRKITTKIMNKKTIRSKARVFSDTYKMETETVFHEDGTIKTFPCAYELGQQITCSGGTVNMKAKVVVDADGIVSVLPYQRNSGERYRRLLTTAHGEVKETNTDVIVKFQFQKSCGVRYICKMLKEEVTKIVKYLKNSDLSGKERKETT